MFATMLAPRQLALCAALLCAPQAVRPQCAPDVMPLSVDEALHRTLVPRLQADAAPRDSVGCVDGARTWRVRAVALQARVSWRSGVPDGRGNGSAPAVLGRTLQVRPGVEASWGRIVARLAPEILQGDNDDFLTFPGADSTRSGHASPFYAGAYSADLPSRPGTRPYTRLDAGESGIWYVGSTWLAGAATGLPDWSPGVGEGLVLGRSAGGLPRLEAEVRRALARGTLRAQWFGGAAVESRFFDTDRKNDQRGIAGLRLSYARPTWTVGVSRTVMDGRRDRAPLGAALLPLVRVGTDSVVEFLAADLLLHHRASGTLAWLELARQAPLASVRDFLLLPAEGLMLRVGLSQTIARSATARWVLALEAVRLDQPAQRADHTPQDAYTSPTVAHGWTHRGEVLGAGAGPGGQHQLVSLDREGAVWTLGGFVERIRWNDDAMYRQFLAYPVRHDVTVQLGLRAAREYYGMRLAAALSGGQRLNYLFQNADYIPGYRTDDVGFVQFSLAIAPAR
jgi:hypothetical protein